MDTAQGKTHSEAIGAVQLHFTIYQCNYSVPAAFQVHWLQGKLHFFFFFGYKLLRSFILREFEILKYNFIPPISPTLWPLALSYFSKTAESRIWWFLIGATGKGMLGAGTQMCLQCLRELRTQAPRVLSWVSPMPSIAESPASDLAETSAVAFPFSRTHLQSGLPRLPNKPGSFSCVSVFRWKSLHAKRAHQTPSS